ncbi:hypothetical protein BDR03DRAFT_914065 [Suillus americanus]|nr:hypothetical protein BDR03DRAFT_914065 [Suillus americanus]
MHWFDIAVPFEFKKEQDIESLRDISCCRSCRRPLTKPQQKIIWSLHSIMREDPRRRFAFGITIEDTQLRLWLSNRAFLAVTEPIDFFENIDGVISHALGSASASSTMNGLGWDPTVERIRDGKEIQYKFTIGDEVFTTTQELATYGADYIVGHGTRVYEATDANGKKVAIQEVCKFALHDIHLSQLRRPPPPLCHSDSNANISICGNRLITFIRTKNKCKAKTT